MVSIAARSGGKRGERTGLICEGLATGRTEFIKDGVLTGYLSNNYYRNKVLHDSSAKDKIGAEPAGIRNALIPRNCFRSGESMPRSFRGRPSIVPANVIVETTGAIHSDELVRQVETVSKSAVSDTHTR